MKKLLLVFLCGLFACEAWGQLRVTSEKMDKIEYISSARAKSVQLNKMGDDWYIAMRSTNRFDKLGVFTLGSTAEEAVETISDLIGLCDKLDAGESVTVNDGDQQVVVRVEKMLGKKYLQFKMRGIAGMLAGITPKELEKFKEAIAKYSNE